MNEAMDAEFDTLASWTADAAVALGHEHYIPAGCRGSGSPAALDWLLENLDIRASDTMLDCGAGVGGPAAYAAQQCGVRPVLAEPAIGACRAARRLFDLPVVRAEAGALPFSDGSMDVAWSLGVICTTDDQLELLRELRRVVAGDARIGLLAFLARRSGLPEQPADNNFPTPSRLLELIGEAGLRVDGWRQAHDLSPEPESWRTRSEAVDDELQRRHHDDAAWQIAQRQSGTIGRLLDAGDLSAELLSLRRAH